MNFQLSEVGLILKWGRIMPAFKWCSQKQSYSITWRLLTAYNITWGLQPIQSFIIHPRKFWVYHSSKKIVAWKDLEELEGTWKDLKGLERTWKDGLETIWKNLKEMKEVQDLEKCDRQTEDRKQTEWLTKKCTYLRENDWFQWKEK